MRSIPRRKHFRCRGLRGDSPPSGVLALRGFALLAALVATAASVSSAVAQAPLLVNNEPDPKHENLRLWLRADSGVKDFEGRGPESPDFSGAVATWADRSAKTYDIKAIPGQAPRLVAQQQALGNRPTVSFNGEQLLTRTNAMLHDRATSSVIIVLQGQQFFGNAYSIGRGGNAREILILGYNNDADGALANISGNYMTTGGERGIALQLNYPSDGRTTSRFGIVISNGEADQRSLEFHDGLGDILGTESVSTPLNPPMAPTPIQSASDRCAHEFTLGAVENERFCGHVAEMIVYNRALSQAERREMVSYLRRRYQLDMTDAFFPSGTFLLQAEDFAGGWQLNVAPPAEGRFLGNRHVTTADPAAAAAGIKTTITIPRDGTYNVWVRAMENDWHAPGSALKTIIQGHELAATHVRGPSTNVVWRKAGEVALKQGPAEILIRGEGPGPKDCDAVFVGTNAATPEQIDENCALAQRVRGVSGPARFTALFENGWRLDGSLLSGWRWTGPSGAIARPDPAMMPALLSVQFDRRAAVTISDTDAILELQNGDRLVGTIVGYSSPSGGPGEEVPAQLQIRPVAGYLPDPKQVIFVDLDWLQRIIFDPAQRDRSCPPKTLLCKDGRRLSFRAIRWSAESVSVLTEDGLERIPLGDIVDVRVASADPWDAYYRELSTLDPDGNATIVGVETLDGMTITASADRSISRVRGMKRRPQQMIGGSQLLLHPVWSRDPIVLPWIRTRLYWQAPAHVVPLSRFAPQQVTQAGALGRSWTWQCNHNVLGGNLNSGGVDFLWGLGVHAANEMRFQLPACARAFRTHVGIDSAVGNSGSAVAKVFVNETTGKPLYQSQALLGMAAPTATGEIPLPAASAGTPRQLVLITESADQQTALDIGDHVDWLEPTLLLDPTALHAEVRKQSAK